MKNIQNNKVLTPCQTLKAALAVAVTVSVLASSQVAAQAELEEVLVTATKRAASLQDVPLSVAAISGETIQEQGFARLDDLANLTPNLMIFDAFTGAGLYVRGLGTSPGNQFVSG